MVEEKDIFIMVLSVKKVQKSDRSSQADAFHSLVREAQKRICNLLESLDEMGSPIQGKSPQTFQKRTWAFREEGGGQSCVLKDGLVFEKAGINVSRVKGHFPEDLAKAIPGTENNKAFEAMGISLVIHPRNPHVPIVHLNTRHIITQASWFGGGTDLTPAIAYAEDTSLFHQVLNKAYDAVDPTYYPKFKAWADEYYFLHHRNEPRGIGGTFYDYVDQDYNFALTQATLDSFCTAYEVIVKRRMHTPWNEDDMKKLIHKRSRYVEFNLIHDRGTLFGLKTGGDIEAILVSLPPSAGW